MLSEMKITTKGKKFFVNETVGREHFLRVDRTENSGVKKRNIKFNQSDNEIKIKIYTHM